MTTKSKKAEAGKKKLAEAGASKKPAKKPQAKKKPAEAVKQQIQAPYHFTPAEVGAMEVDLRSRLQNIDNLTDQKKQSQQDFKLRIDGETNAIKQLRIKLDSGQETRPLEAHVTFDPARNKKSFLHPTTGDFIREEDMTPADYQLPMFKEEEMKGAKKPAEPELPLPGGKPEPMQPPKPAKPAKNVKPPKSSPKGNTNVGDVLDKATAMTNAAAIELDLRKTWEPHTLEAAFRKAARKAAWTPAQISLIGDRLKETETVEAMADTLRPFVKVAAEEQKDATSL